MQLRNNLSLASLVMVLTLGVLSTLTPAQEAKPDKQKVVPTGTPLLWRDPGDITARDLLLGPGGEEMKPNLTSVTFLEEETGGYSPKFRVRDGARKIWVAKFGKEAQPETVAARLVWAVGYVGEFNYLVPCVQIAGAPEPRKEVDRWAV